MDYLLFLADFVGLVAGGDRLVANALRLAHRAGLSVLVAGVVIVGFGTSLPELVTSVDANLQGYQGAAIGNILGSNIANLLLVLGVSTLWLPAAADPVSAKRDGAWLLGAAIASVALMQLDVIGRLAGSALVAGLVVYIYVSLKNGRQDGGEEDEGEDEDKSASGSTLSRDGFDAVLGVAALTIGAHFMVNGAMGIAADFDIPETVIGIVLLALGTSLPELTVTVVALSRGKADLALGNVLGSTLFNLLGILGVAALMRPLVVPQSAADVHVWVMAGACVLTVCFMRSGWRLSRIEGGILLGSYPAYLIFAL